MPLSEYELRVLQEMEVALRPTRYRRLARGRRSVAAHWRVVLVILVALAIIVSLALFAPAAAAAPIAAVAGAVVGWTAARDRLRGRPRAR